MIYTLFAELNHYTVSPGLMMILGGLVYLDRASSARFARIDTVLPEIMRRLESLENSRLQSLSRRHTRE